MLLSKMIQYGLHKNLWQNCLDVHLITPKEEVFVKILPQLDCQFIVPSIRSSLTVLGEDFIKENTILELSKTNKLFRIEEYDSIEKYKY